MPSSQSKGSGEMKKKILVVDNDPVMLKFMTNLLEKRGHQVLTAKDGLSAIDVLKDYVPDITFIDLIMPNISGEKLCRFIRSRPRLKDVYIVILSAIAAEEDVDFARFGANACICKGPLNKMAKHVFLALEQSDLGIPYGLSKKAKQPEWIRPRQITEELLSSKRHFEAILGSMLEGVLELTPGGKIVYANRAAISVTGIPEEKLLASNFIDLFSDTDRRRVRNLLEAIDSGPQIIAEDSPVILNSKQVLLNLSPVEDKGDKFTIVILTDVTEQKRVQVQLRQAQKMEAIGTLAGGIAHDFNNLLMGIQGNVSLMLLNVDSTHPQYQRLKNIEELVQSGSKLTKQLLAYARKGKYQIKPINVNGLIEETSDMFGRTKKEIRIHRTLEKDLFPILADRGQMEQVLLNLYVNAWQAMPGGGELFLETRNTTDKDIDSRLHEPKPGKYVMIAVTDTGTGMDKKTQERIFDPFFTTREMGRGTGLGLASAYGIIKSHGGYIDLDSEKGRGTTFRIYLPAAARQVSREKTESPGEVLKGKQTILFVDDEEMVLDVGSRMLKELGYKVFVAKSGKEALEIYEKNRDTIDLVILDMIMPGISGGNTYDRMKEINDNIKVLLSSGYSINGEATDILERGCSGFIQKPFTIEQLSRKIREILNPQQGDDSPDS